MATSPTSPSPYPPPGYAEIPRKRSLWKWVVGGVVAMCLFLMWQCGSTFLQGRRLSDPAVQHFHQELNAEDYEGIVSNASDEFATTKNHDEVVEFLRAVHKKLGNAGDSSFTNIRVDKNTRGTFTTTSYETIFDRGKASERFTWVRDNGAFRLYYYHIESNALVTH
jgi:hypothetical protein